MIRQVVDLAFGITPARQSRTPSAITAHGSHQDVGMLLDRHGTYSPDVAGLTDIRRMASPDFA